MDSRNRAVDDLPEVARSVAIVLSLAEPPTIPALTLKAAGFVIVVAVLVGVLVFALTGVTP
jgi:hypothetical protein